jgi:putative membrane protein
MQLFLIRLVINAIALGVTAAILPGIEVADNGIWTLLLVSLIFGAVNAILKPVLFILSCPLILFSLGLFLLVINGILLLITDAIAGSRLEVDGLGWAVLGGIVMGLVGMTLESILGVDEDEDNDKGDKVVIIKR